MSFNSFQFFFFLIAVLGVYYCLPHRKQNLLLLVASYIFYGSVDYRFLFLILLSTAMDYFIGFAIHRSPEISKKRMFLVLSIVVNLGILCFFKYFDFFVSSATDLLALFGLHVSKFALNIALPLGISFYTFKTLSYVIDVYRGQIEPCRKFEDYAIYISFFPQLVSGPIERSSTFFPQLENERRIDKDKIVQGLWLILWGFFKKLVIADNLAIYVNNVFTLENSFTTGMEVLLAIYAFTFQIYCDFSGYTDIARGLGKLLGFETPLNFNLPYVASNPVEFWKRWHITLSNWLRDYIFLPIAYATMRWIKKPAFNLKVENWGYIVGIFLTMLVGGLWHGANWTFVCWGAYHGAILAVHHIMTRRKKGKKKKKRTPKQLKILNALKTIGFFHLVCFGWFIFKASDFSQLGRLMGLMLTKFKSPTFLSESLYPLVFYVPVLLIFEIWIRSQDDPRKSRGWNVLLGPIAVSVIIVALILFSTASGAGFIYTQF